MATVKPFRGIRPPKQIASAVSSKPYDVLSSEEAKEEAKGNEKSLYHIIKPEIDFPAGTQENDPVVYEAAVKNFNEFLKNGWLVKDDKEQYYIYSQTMGSHTQYGLVVAASVNDYLTGKIKKHELTRREKETDRMQHIRVNNANIEPVFLAYPDNERLAAVVSKLAATTPEYDFTSDDGITHKLWCVDADDDIKTVTEEFAKIPYLYIADGHHRTAAAAHVGEEKAKASKDHKGDEEYNYLLAVCFPQSQLKVMDYNRVITDLNGLTEEEFLQKLVAKFDVKKIGSEIYHPTRHHNFAMYINHTWYSLTAHSDIYNDEDPIETLDVKILSDNVLADILGIKDLRTDKRIDFVGGIRGLEELKKRVDSGEMKLAFALYPVTMQQIIDIADSGEIMPPKATWFEPKLRSGLVIHSLE